MSLNMELDILGQNPFLKIYTQISSIYALPDISLRPSIISTLQSGLERLSASFPWVAGQIINEGASEGNSGTYKILPFEKTVRLVVKDLSEDESTPSMDELEKAGFPSRMLEETVIAPRMTFPGGPGEGPTDPAPVFAVQANFIAGGLILTFVAAHNATDMTGQAQVIYLLSKACRSEPFTEEELTTGNMSRSKLVPFFDDSYDPTPDLQNQTAPPPPSPSGDGEPPAAPPVPPKSSWAYFNFSPESLAAMKTEATASLSSGFVSTDDTLTAFIWQGIARARLPRLSPTREVNSSRAVDVRTYLNVPKTYPGLLQNLTYATCTLQSLIDSPLGSIAAQLRSKLDPAKLAHSTRALATLLNRLPDKTSASFVAAMDLSADIMLSSWVRPPFYEWDFGLGLEKPESVRRPQFTPVESLLYLMPKSDKHGIAAGLCLRDEDMDRLRADEKFTKYGKYVG